MSAHTGGHLGAGAGGTSGVGAASAGVESSPLETELRDLITKMQSSFTQIIHSQAAIVRANRGT